MGCMQVTRDTTDGMVSRTPSPQSSGLMSLMTASTAPMAVSAGALLHCSPSRTVAPKLADILEARASVAYQGDIEQRDEAVSERVQTEAETEPTGHQQIGRERIRCDQDDEGREPSLIRARRRYRWRVGGTPSMEYDRRISSTAWCSAMNQASVGAGSSLKQ